MLAIIQGINQENTYVTQNNNCAETNEYASIAFYHFMENCAQNKKTSLHTMIDIIEHTHNRIQ